MDSSGVTQENMTVFNSIAELVTSTDFGEACSNFLEKHLDTFDDEEENKLEYTEIFEEYVQILEKVIDSKLYESY